MRTKFVIATLLMTVLLICSCGGGSGSDSDSSAQKAVAVGFDLNILGTPEKALTVEDPTITAVEFWYKATPKWDSADGFEIQGDTKYNSAKDSEGFVQLPTTFTLSNPSGQVGYFAKGRWEFEVQIKKVLSTDSTTNAKTYAVLWKTASPQQAYINDSVSATNPITLTVTKNIDTTKNGTVKFNVSAPKTSNTDSFNVKYVKLGTTTEVTPSASSVEKGGAADSPTATLTGTATLPAGFYAVTVEYYSDTNKLVGISTVAAEVVPGEEVKIGGTIENGKWQQTYFSIKGMYKLAVSFTAKLSDAALPDISTVHVGDDIEFTGKAELKNIDGTSVTGVSKTYTYEWRINGAKQNESTEAFSYEIAAGDANSYLYVDCIAYFKDGTGENAVNIGSSATTFRLVVKP